MNNHLWLFSILLLSATLVSSDVNTLHTCTTGTTGTGSKYLKVGFLFAGTQNDGGYNTNTEIDRVAALNNLSLEFTIDWEKCQNFTVADPDISTIVTRWSTEGFSLIIGNSFTFQSRFVTLASTYTSIKFAAGVTAYETIPPSNLKWHFGRSYRDRFLTGMVCANITTTKKLGFVAPFAFRPGSVSAPSSFLAGARFIDPEITLYYISIGTYEHPSSATIAAGLLYDLGVDCIGGLESTNTIQSYFATRNRYSVGWNNPTLVDENEFTSINLYWAPFYIQFINQVYDGTFDDNPYQLYTYSASSYLPLTSVVPNEVKAAVAAKAQAYSESEDIFCGSVGEFFNVEFGLPLNSSGCLANYDAVVGSFLPPYSHIPGTYLVSELAFDGTKRCYATDYSNDPIIPHSVSWQAKIQYGDSGSGAQPELAIFNGTGIMKSVTASITNSWESGQLVRWILSYDSTTKGVTLTVTQPSGSTILSGITVAGASGKIFIIAVAQNAETIVKEVRIYRSTPDYCGIVYDTITASGTGLRSRTLEIGGVIQGGSFELKGKFIWNWTSPPTSVVAPRISFIVENI